MNEEGIMLRMNENGKFEEYKEPYGVIECPEKEDYDHIVEMVEKGEKMRWIPVTERLPDESDGDYVLVCATCKVTDKIEYRNAVVMAFVGEEGFVDAEMDEVLTGVTHWMPLPDAPEEVSNV